MLSRTDPEYMAEREDKKDRLRAEYERGDIGPNTLELSLKLLGMSPRDAQSERWLIDWKRNERRTARQA